jgi:hypothetical protein
MHAVQRALLTSNAGTTLHQVLPGHHSASHVRVGRSRDRAPRHRPGSSTDVWRPTHQSNARPSTASQSQLLFLFPRARPSRRSTSSEQTIRWITGKLVAKETRPIIDCKRPRPSQTSRSAPLAYCELPFHNLAGEVSARAPAADRAEGHRDRNPSAQVITFHLAASASCPLRSTVPPQIPTSQDQCPSLRTIPPRKGSQQATIRISDLSFSRPLASRKEEKYYTTAEHNKPRNERKFHGCKVLLESGLTSWMQMESRLQGQADAQKLRSRETQSRKLIFEVWVSRLQRSSPADTNNC